jgi:hypothetical protein
MVFADMSEKFSSSMKAGAKWPHLVPRARYQKILISRTRYLVVKHQRRHGTRMALVELDGFPRL